MARLDSGLGGWGLQRRELLFPRPFVAPGCKKRGGRGGGRCGAAGTASGTPSALLQLKTPNSYIKGSFPTPGLFTPPAYQARAAVFPCPNGRAMSDRYQPGPAARGARLRSALPPLQSPPRIPAPGSRLRCARSIFHCPLPTPGAWSSALRAPFFLHTRCGAAKRAMTTQRSGV